jgi:hypothetical protein
MTAVGLILVLGSHAIPAQAQHILPSETLALDHADAISRAFAYVRTQQQPDGGIDAYGMGYGSSESGTARGVLALVSAGRPATWIAHTSTGKSMIDYLASHTISYTHQDPYTTAEYLFPENAGLVLAAAAAANENPTSFGGMNLLAQLKDTYNPATGAYSTTARDDTSTGEASTANQAWAILGLSAVAEPVPVTATDFLIGRHSSDGSWHMSGQPDPEATALAVVALIGSGNAEPIDMPIVSALDFFRRSQLPSGGWRRLTGTDPASANSTGWVIQALVAAGHTPATLSWGGSRNPHTALVDMQKPDGRIGGEDPNTLSTLEAVFGLSEQPLFYLGRTRRALRALAWMNELQDADGSWPTLFGPPAGPTCDAVLAYAAAGFDPRTVVRPGSITSAMDYLSSTATAYAVEGPKEAGKLAAAVAAGGLDPHSFGGIDVIDVLSSTHYSATTGFFGDGSDSWSQSLGIIGLSSGGESIPVSATETLLAMQDAGDGSWVDPWGFSKLDTTGLALQALIAAGVPSNHTSVVSGLAFLQGQQSAHGGWDFGSSPSANSTAYAIQGAVAAGEDLEADWLSDAGHSPYDALATLQKLDGPFVYLVTDDFFATRQAVPALLGASFPISPGTLIPFEAVLRGADPDRTVAEAPRVAWRNGAETIIPYGSDLDEDGVVALDWRVRGSTSWVTGTPVLRADGYFTATVGVIRPGAYEFRATFTDPDGVQYSSEITGTAILGTRLECRLLPLTSRGWP